MASGFLLADAVRFRGLQGYGLSSFMAIFPIYVAVALNGDAWSIAALQSADATAPRQRPAPCCSRWPSPRRCSSP